jgi:hypothetical protein
MPLAFAAGVELNLVFGRRQFVCAVPQLWSLENGHGRIHFRCLAAVVFQAKLATCF